VIQHTIELSSHGRFLKTEEWDCTSSGAGDIERDRTIVVKNNISFFSVSLDKTLFVSCDSAQPVRALHRPLKLH